jgi:hypothetical protein
LTSKDFCIPNPLPDTPSPIDFFQFLDKELSNGSNSWQRLMPTNNRLTHYLQSKRPDATDVPVGWTSDLAQYNWYLKTGLYIDDEATGDWLGVPRHHIYSITNKDGKRKKNEAPMLPFEYSFQIIASCHVELNRQGEYTHLSRDKTYDKVSKITSTITKAVINGFIQHCPHATCAGRRVKGKQHSTDVAAAKKRKAESGPSTDRPPKRGRTRPQSQQEHQPPFPNVQMGQFNNDHLFRSSQLSDIWSQIYDSQQRNEGYQPQQHQQPYFPNVSDVQNDINDDNFAAPQQPANVQMEQVNNGYPLQPSLIGQPGYEGYTGSIRSEQQLANVQTGDNNTIDPALLGLNSADDQNNKIDPALSEHNSPNYQEQPQEPAATGNVPADQNDNREEGFGFFFDFDPTAEANPMPDFDYRAAYDPSSWQLY